MIYLYSVITLKMEEKTGETQSICYVGKAENALRCKNYMMWNLGDLIQATLLFHNPHPVSPSHTECFEWSSQPPFGLIGVTLDQS